MSTDKKTPYVGPRTFLREESELFYGREREARDLLALVVSEQVVLFYAQSGAGKSSLVNTRLIPSLEKKGFEVLPVGRVSGDAPPGLEVDNIYIFNLMRNLVQHETDPASLAQLSLTDFLDYLNNDEAGYFYDNSPIPETSEEETYTPWRRALIIDQFEELFSTHTEAWAKREDFFSQLAKSMQNDPYLWVVLVMREDYIAALDPFAYLMPGGLRMRYYMQRLEKEAALKAIKKPVEQIRPFVDGVAEKLVEDLCSIKTQSQDGKLDMQPGQYVEPVQLQVVCYSLWENLDEGKEITENDLEAVGDVNQSLGRYYAGRVKAVAESKKVKERSIREWFEKKLITAGGIRNMVLQEPSRRSGGLADDVIQALQSDLVRAETHGGATFYELTHDRLVEPILENNRKWMEEHSSLLQKLATIWANDPERKESLLSTEQQLVELEQWAQEFPYELTGTEIDFLEACRKKQREIDRESEIQRQREEQEREAQEQKLEAAQRLAKVHARSARITRIFLALTAIAFGFAVWTTIRAFESADEANYLKILEEAAKSTAVSAQATAQYSANYSRANELAGKSLDTSRSFDQSILLSVAAYDKSPQNRTAQNALYQNFQKVERLQRIYADPENFAKGFEISPNGGVLAIWGEGGITIWNQIQEKPVTYPVTDLSLKMYFSPDSKTLAVVGRNGIRRWNAETLEPMDGIDFNGHPGEITHLVLGRDGKTLVTVAEDNSVQRWDLDTFEKTAISIESENITVGPYGKMLTAVDRDGNIELWSVAENKRIGAPMPFNKAAISPDEKKLAMVNVDKSVTIWDLATGQTMIDITPRSDGEVNQMIFSPNGGYLAVSILPPTPDSPPVTEIWNIDRQDQIGQTLTGVPLSFSTDEEILFVNNYEVLEAYCISSEEAIDFAVPGTIAGFSRDGKTMAVKDSDGTVSLWNISDPCVLTLLNEEETIPAETIQLSPAGDMLAGLESDGAIMLQDLIEGVPTDKPVYLYQPPEIESDTDDAQIQEIDTKGKLIFNSDGSLLAFLGENSLYLWDLANNREKIELPGSLLPGTITNLVFSEDGLLIAAHVNGLITFWNIKNGQVEERATDARGQITNLIFDDHDPETQRMLSISRNSVFLLDMMTGEPLSGPMYGKYLDVNWQRNLLATLQNGNIALWNIETGRMKRNTVKGTKANFTNDGRALLISNGAELALYNAALFAPIGEPVENFFQSYDIIFSPNDKVFALAGPPSSGSSSVVYIYSIGPNSLEEIYRARYNYGGLMAFSSDNTIYFKEDGSWIDVIDLGNDNFQQDRGLSNGSIPIHLDSKTFILGIPKEGDHPNSLASVAVWDVENFDVPPYYPEFIQTINVDLAQSLNMLDFRFRQVPGEADPPDSKVLATLGEDGKVYLWSLDKEIADANNKPIIAAAISSDSEKRAAFTKEGIVIDSTTGDPNPSQPFNEHIMKIDSGYFNQTGNILAVMGENDQTVFYDLGSLERVGEAIDGIFDVTFSDKEIWLTVNSTDETKAIWDSKTGKKIKDVANTEGFEGNSPDGRYIAMRNNEQIILWDAATVKQIGGNNISGNFKGFSPNNVQFAVVDEGNAILWRIGTDGSVEKRDPITGNFIAFSPGGRYAAIDDTEGGILLLDTESGNIMGEPIKGVFMAFRPKLDPEDTDAELMAYHNEGQIFLWNIVDMNGFGQRIKGSRAAFSPDGRILASFFFDPNTNSTTTSLLDTETGQQIIDPFQGEFKFAPNSEILIITSTDTEPDGRITKRLWRLTGEQIDKDADYSGVADFSQDGGTLIIRNPNGTVTLRDVFDVNKSTDLNDADTVLFSADNQYAAAINEDNKNISLWDVNSRSQVNVDFTSIDISSVETVVFSPPGAERKTLALLGSDGILLLDIDTGEHIEAFREKSGLVRKLMFSPGNNYLASLGSDGIIISELGQTPGFRRKTDDNTRIIDMTFSGNDRITYLSEDYNLIEFDINSGVSIPLGKPVNNPKAVCGYALSPDGSKLAYQIQRNVLLWDKATPASMAILSDIKINSPCNGGSGTLAFSPDGAILAIADGGRIHLWNLNNKADSFLNVSSTPSTAARIVFVHKVKNNAYAIAVQSAPSAESTQKTSFSLWDLDSRSSIGEPLNGDLTKLTSNASKLLYRDAGNRLALLDLSTEDLTRFNEMRSFLCNVVSGREFSQGEWEQFFPNEEYQPICARPSSVSQVISTPTP